MLWVFSENEQCIMLWVFLCVFLLLLLLFLPFFFFSSNNNLYESEDSGGLVEDTLVYCQLVSDNQTRRNASNGFVDSRSKCH